MAKRVSHLHTQVAAKPAASEFSLHKSDIQYDAQKQEVTLKREKFDALVGYMGKLAEQLETAEDHAAIARYNLRRTQALEGVFQGALGALRSWLDAPGNSIQALATRAGIPYATCHRLVTARMEEQKVSVGDLIRILGAIEEASAAQVFAAEHEANLRDLQAFLPKPRKQIRVHTKPLHLKEDLKEE